ncbi:MAG: glycoside hydrolase family 31 protein [Bacteroidota bacterium]|nr:glycoside hydrolase family 31 protein [Bacteroidota bacterium]MDP4196694.1 glycoside hydrolase family 31 protein [Bacteroidota bacterium]
MKHYIMLFLNIALLSTFCLAQKNDPSSDPKSLVTSGNARFTVITPQLIRMEYSDNGKFEDHASFVVINRKLDPPKYSLKEKDGWLEINTEKLKLEYKKNSGKFSSNNLRITFQLNNKQVTWHPGMKNEHNLKGTTRTLDGWNGGSPDRLEDGVVSRDGWYLLDDSKSFLFDNSDWNWVMKRPDEELQDWYFLGHGHDYKKALSDYTKIAGPIPMPPKFAFGYWWSRYWNYSDDELKDLVNTMKSLEIPIDVLIIDMDWHRTYGLGIGKEKKDEFGETIGWTGYSWNREYFPDPEGFLKWTDKKELKTALNLHPASGIAPMEDQYNDFAKEYGFDTTGRKNIPFKIEDKKWAKTYFDVVLHPMEKMGIDFWWLDWQQWRESKELKGLSNTWWLNYTFFTEMEREGLKRPLLFHRWGGLGNHRYQIGFSGDAYCTWDMLSFEPYFTATAANVGYGYWSHDIGGHIPVGNSTNPELYLRWIQFATFSPIVRTHCTKSAEIERRIWKFPDHFEMMRDALQLRYALAPYIYNSARKAYETGLSICRPMYYDFPEKDEAYDFTGQYFFGDDMLVSPVASPIDSKDDLVQKKIWLPEGDWFEWSSGTMLKGDRIIERNFALNEIPVYLRSGSVIPMYPKIDNLQNVVDKMILAVAPGVNSFSLDLYEDDGKTDNYRKNEYSRTKIEKTCLSDGSLELVINPVNGSYSGMSDKKSYEIRLLRSQVPEKVLVNGKEFAYNIEGTEGSWNYSGEDLTVHIYTAKIPVDTKAEITIKFSQSDKNLDNLLNGKAGQFSRLKEITGRLKYEIARINWAGTIPEDYLRISQMASKITAHPEELSSELNYFEKNYDMAVNKIIRIEGINQQKVSTLVRHLGRQLKFLDKPTLKIYEGNQNKTKRLEILSQDLDTKTYYTIDGSDPNENSKLYIDPIEITRSTYVKAISYKDGFIPSIISDTVISLPWAKSVKYKYPYDARYTGNNENALIDGVRGSMDKLNKNWIGFNGDDLEAVIELFKPEKISTLTASFLNNQNSWIFLPQSVTYEVSEDGINFKKVYDENLANVSSSQLAPFVKEVKAKVDKNNVRFIKIIAKNLGVIPNWHSAKGEKPWLFVDEVYINN